MLKKYLVTFFQLKFTPKSGKQIYWDYLDKWWISFDSENTNYSYIKIKGILVLIR
jgi:hypothetical protein